MSICKYYILLRLQHEFHSYIYIYDRLFKKQDVLSSFLRGIPDIFELTNGQRKLAEFRMQDLSDSQCTWAEAVDGSLSIPHYLKELWWLVKGIIPKYHFFRLVNWNVIALAVSASRVWIHVQVIFIFSIRPCSFHRRPGPPWGATRSSFAWSLATLRQGPQGACWAKGSSGVWSAIRRSMYWQVLICACMC